MIMIILIKKIEGICTALHCTPNDILKFIAEDETLIALDEIKNELNSKKYGLVWKKHEEEVDRMMQDNIPVFTEVKEREIKATDENAYNFLLEGDNLHSLKLLEKTYTGKIDVIYIEITLQ